MMSNPIPVPVPDLQKTFHSELEEVKIVQPHPSPEQSLIFEPRVKKDEEETKEQTDEVVVVKKALSEDLITTSLEPVEILEGLAPLDRLLVTRRLQVRDAMSLKGKRNHFLVMTADQELLYTIEESNSWWVGYCCYGLRPLQLRVMDNAGTEVMRISRPYAFTTRILPCQLQRIQVFSPPGQLIGTVMQQWTAVRPFYTVKDIHGSIVFEVHGPCITLSFFQEVKFQVKRPDGSLVAATSKPWEGLLHALFFAPVKEKFSMSFFEKEMKREEKALLLATALLLDYMYYNI